MNNTLEANNIFLNSNYKECNSKKNTLIKNCYRSLEILDTMKGELSPDQLNYIDEYLHRIIMILTNENKQNNINIFNKSYSRNNLNNLPINYSTLTWDQQLKNAEYNNQTLSVPEEYKILTSLDKQLAYNKYGEKIVIPFNNITDNNPLENAINSSQYIAGNGFDISRHIKPMSLQKFK